MNLIPHHFIITQIHCFASVYLSVGCRYHVRTLYPLPDKGTPAMTLHYDYEEEKLLQCQCSPLVDCQLLPNTDHLSAVIETQETHRKHTFYLLFIFTIYSLYDFITEKLFSDSQETNRVLIRLKMQRSPL